LLTCSPHQVIYGFFGHTAIRFHDLRSGDDWTFNYGIFNMHIPFFIPRFVFGLTDYEMGVMPFDVFCEEYRHFGSSVTEQILNLTSEEKIRLRDALIENYRPENRKYRYNYFYDNCTTRPRDMIQRCINGNVKFADDETLSTTYRDMVHECTAMHPWASFGIDLALGAKSDVLIDRPAQEFLPARLMNDFDHAIIIGKDGKNRSLVLNTRTDIQPGVQVVESEFPLTPTECATILLIITIGLTVYEYIKKKTLWGYDAVLMLITGAGGLLIFFLLFSEHPTTTLNFEILILNPLPLIFLPRMIKRSLKNGKDNFFRWSIIPIVLYYMAHVFGIQYIPAPMLIVALSLLIRCISRSKFKIAAKR
jgi:hypothetical protein